MTFIHWAFLRPYPYVAIAIPAVVLLYGYSWKRVALAFFVSGSLFMAAGWVAYRRGASARAIQVTKGGGLVPPKAQRADGLRLVPPITRDGPALAEFDRRIPRHAEAKVIREKGFGLAVKRLPQAHRALDFLDEFPDLTALWIAGPVQPSRIATMVNLSQLSLLTTTAKLDLSALRHLQFYEGALRGRETVLTLPSIRELFLDHVDGGAVKGMPPALEILGLYDATNIDTLSFLAGATRLDELHIDGSRSLDVSAITHARSLRTLALSNIESLAGLAALSSLNKLESVTIERVKSIDQVDVLDNLRDVEVVVG